MLKSLKLLNFTAFSDLNIEFSPKINIIIGENSTGKTHLIKSAYALCKEISNSKQLHGVNSAFLEYELTSSITELFNPSDRRLSLLRHNRSQDQVLLEASFSTDEKIQMTFNSKSKKTSVKSFDHGGNKLEVPIFIPAKEVISLVKGIEDLSKDHHVVAKIFDGSYLDLVSALMRPVHEDLKSKINIDPRIGTIIPNLVNLIGGRYQWNNGDFMFQKGQYVESKSPNNSRSSSAQAYQDNRILRFTPTDRQSLNSNLTAEGFRKIGMLYQLLANGSLEPGVSGTLFGDEPESNMNPKMMKPFVQAMLELSRNGQQIVLATHDYVLLKWFDLLNDVKKDDHVRFHSLTKNSESMEVELESVDNYRFINRSSISDAFAELYDEDIRRALG